MTSKPKTKPTKFSKEIITSMIADHSEAVLTTIDVDGTASSSVITLHKFNDYHYFFMTKDTTKKYSNLEIKPNATLLIFDPFSRTELEIKGFAEFIWDEHTRRRALRIIERDTQKGRHHTSPFVSSNDEVALYHIHPQSMHLTTFWDRGNGPEMFKATIEFKVSDED